MATIARDTRESSSELAGWVDTGGEVVDLGVVTTLQLHVAVRCRRCRAEPATVDDYYLQHCKQRSRR